MILTKQILIFLTAFSFAFTKTGSEIKNEKGWEKTGKQEVVHLVPGGKIYKMTLRDEPIKFERAEYSVFIPDGVQKIRGVFVHQHGCTMEGRGVATAHDLQYQAFAKKWHLAVVGPDLYPWPGSGCGDWRDPIEDGSGPTLIKALERIGELSNHAEMGSAPWLLWGHSGGGYWVLAMLNEYPERIMAAVAYSPAFDPQFPYSEAATKVPLLIRHAGPKDFNNPGVDCWGTSLHTFSKLRSMGGLVSLAYNAGQNHNFTYLRDMAIPFYESVLKQRLPADRSNRLKDMDQTKAWLCDTTTKGEPQIYKAVMFSGDPQTMSWLPDSACAAKFSKYISTGRVKDVTPPPSPKNVKLKKKDGTLTINWTAEADIESGIRCFNFYRNGGLVMRYPPFGDFQSFSTNGDDAIPVVPPPMSATLMWDDIGAKDSIWVTTVNRFDLESAKTQIRFK
jgi:pimeloyl-ACP methyl ester carboxylesterase